MIADLPSWAEDKFSGLCSRAGVTRNKSQQDRTGWDYLVEFPPLPNPAVPSDLKLVEASARIQVKSKRSGKASVPIKLSNMLRFAKDPLPCFVILFLASNGDEPVRVFARHYWEPEIGDALKRARRAHASGRDDLNKIHVRMVFEKADEHSANLMDWMANIVREHHDRYAEVKANIVRSIGFDGRSWHGKLSFNSEDIEALVDHQIGLNPFAPKMNVVLKQQRFGIDATPALFDGTPDFVLIQPHPRLVRVRIRGAVGSDIWLDGELLLPALPGLSPNLLKARIVAQFIDATASPTKGGSIIFHVDREYTLPALRALVDVLILGEAGPLDIEVFDGDHRLPFSAKMNPTDGGALETDQLSNVIACLEKVSAGVLPSDLSLSVPQIYEAWNDLVRFNGMVTGTDMQCQFTFEKGSPMPEKNSDASTSFFYDYVDVGAWTFLAVVRRDVCKFEIYGNTLSLEFSDAKVVEAEIHKGSGALRDTELRALYARCKNRQKESFEICDGNYRVFTALCNT